jgi:tetratricopeptide (TPR) repeat protein
MSMSAKSGQVRNIAVFFKNVDERQKRDRGPQLKQVLAHQKRIEKEKRYLFKSYDPPDTFCDELRKHLAQWLRDHEKGAAGAAIGDLAGPSGFKITSGVPTPTPPETPPPNFRFWIEEANRLIEAGAAETATYSDALFCARKALASGASDLERAEAKFTLGVCQLRLNKPADALATFSDISTEFDSASDTDRNTWQSKALVNKGVTLSQLGRGEDAIAVFDDVIARFGAASEFALRERVAKALFNKGVTLGQLGRDEEVIAVYDDVIARFGAASEFALREQVAKALFNKGYTLGHLGRSEEAISIYDVVIARFGAASELALRDPVVSALVNKGVKLGQLGRSDEAVSIFDDVIARFGADEDPALKAIVQNAKRLRSRHGSKTESQ